MVNTFLPFSDFRKVAKCLDDKRLLKQRVEAYQIIEILKKHRKSPSLKIAWLNHPATQMWKGYDSALKLYYNTILDEVKSRGFKNTMKKYQVRSQVKIPWWMDYLPFHKSHQASLLRKDKKYYSKCFRENKKYSKYSYVWPSHLTEKQQYNIKKYQNGELYKNPYTISDIAQLID